MCVRLGFLIVVVFWILVSGCVLVVCVCLCLADCVCLCLVVCVSDCLRVLILVSCVRVCV